GPGAEHGIQRHRLVHRVKELDRRAGGAREGAGLFEEDGGDGGGVADRDQNGAELHFPAAGRFASSTMRTSWATELAAIFSMTCARWISTVRCERPSSPAMTLLGLPCVIRPRTSRS